MVGLIPPKSADLVGNSIGSAQNLRLNGRYGKKHMRIGTWNVRTMQKRGKLENIKREMSRNRLNILGLSEVRWKESRDLTSDGVRMICTAAKQGQGGIAILLDRETSMRVMKIVLQNDCLFLVKIQAEPADLVIIQVYMPTSTHEDNEVEELYEQLDCLIKAEKGDWNCIIGEGQDEKEVGAFGLGTRNERGERLVEFCRQRKLVATYTCFEHEKRRRYTWKLPGDTRRYQLDYILVRQRFRNSVKNSCSYPGADADSDHNLVVMKQTVKLKKLKRRRKKLQWNLQKLEAKVESFQNKVNEKIRDNNQSDVSIEGKWKILKNAVLEVAKNEVGYRTGSEARKPWVTHEMIRKMDERRKWKNVSTDVGVKKYKQLNNELRRETDKAREDWWMEQSQNLDELDSKGRTDVFYRKLHQLTGQNIMRNSSKAIKDKDGTLLTDKSDIIERWRIYIETLYDAERKPGKDSLILEQEEEVEKDCIGPDLIVSEIRAAIKELKSRKAVGIDNIPAEFWKNLGKEATIELMKLCERIYKEGIWPEDFTKAVLIPLPKKMNAMACEDHRTISLIPHATKIMLRILTKRLEGKIRDFISKTQFGFKKGCGTREAIGVMQMLCEKVLDHRKEVFICFVDYEKAFDRVNWVKMMDTLKQLGVDWRDRKLIWELYIKQQAVVRVADEYTDTCSIGRGVRQGCSLSPLLFSIYAERMMVEALDGVDEGVKVGGSLLKDIKFADDQGMVAETERGLQIIMNRLNDASKEYGMKINIKKTKVMKDSKQGGGNVNIVLNEERIKQVAQFRYLGSLITDNGSCSKEIKARIGMAKTAFNRRRELLTRGISRKVKKKIIKTEIWRVFFVWIGDVVIKDGRY